MGAFFKRVGLGILYIIGCPFFLLLLAIFTVYGVLIFVFNIIKWLVLFFTGRSLFDDLPEDKKAKEIIAQREALSNPNNQDSYQREPQPAYRQNNVYGFQAQDENQYNANEEVGPLPFENKIDEDTNQDFDDNDFDLGNDEASTFENEEITVTSEPETNTIQNETEVPNDEHVSSNEDAQVRQDNPIMGFYTPRGGEDDD